MARDTSSKVAGNHDFDVLANELPNKRRSLRDPQRSIVQIPSAGGKMTL